MQKMWQHEDHKNTFMEIRTDEIMSFREFQERVAAARAAASKKAAADNLRKTLSSGYVPKSGDVQTSPNAPITNVSQAPSPPAATASEPEPVRRAAATATGPHPPGLVIPGGTPVTVDQGLTFPGNEPPEYSGGTGTGTIEDLVGGGHDYEPETPFTQPGYGGTYLPPGQTYTPPTEEETRQSAIRASGGTQTQSERIDMLIAQGYTPEYAIYGFRPQQPEDLTNAPQGVRDLVEKGWIITSETVTTNEIPKNMPLPFLPYLPPQKTVTTYYGTRPTTSQTFEFVYGKDRADVLTGTAFSKTFMGLGTVGSAIQEYITGDKKVGEAELESLQAYALKTQEYKARDENYFGGMTAAIFTSPAVQETVMWAGMEITAPYLFSGAGMLLTKTGRASEGLMNFGTKLSTRLTEFGKGLTPAGESILTKTVGTAGTIIETTGLAKKPIIETGKAFGKAAGTRLGQATLATDLYLAIEGPRLITTAKTHPEQFGGELLHTAGLWTAMSASILSGTKHIRPDTQPSIREDYTGFTRTLQPAKRENIIQQFITRNKGEAPGYARGGLSSRLGTGSEILGKRVESWDKTINPYYKRTIPKEKPAGTPTIVSKDLTTRLSTEDIIAIQKHPEAMKWEMEKRTTQLFAKEPLTESTYQEALKYQSMDYYDPLKFLREPAPKKLDLTATPSGDIYGKVSTQKRAIELTGKTDMEESMRTLSIEHYDPNKQKLFKTKPRDWFTKREAKLFIEDTTASKSYYLREERQILRRPERGLDIGGGAGQRRFRFTEEWKGRVEQRQKIRSKPWEKPGGKYWKTRLIEEMESPDISILRLGAVGIVGQLSSDRTLTYTGYLPASILQTDLFTDTEHIFDTHTTDITIEDTSTDTLDDTISDQDYTQDTITDFIPRTDTIFWPEIIRTPRRTVPRPPTPRPPPPVLKLPPFFPKEKEEYREQEKHRHKREQLGFIPQVHEKGKWTSLTRKTLTQREAKNLLASALDETKAAVGRLLPSKGSLQSLGSLGLKDFSQISYKFKEKGNLLIEKREYRMDSKGEERQITAKGWAANKLKGRETRNKNDFFSSNKYNSIKLKPLKIKRTNKRRKQQYV